MNLLILSPGRRVEIVNYFKNEVHKIGGCIYTIDMSEYAPALYFGDKWYIIKKDFNNTERYIDEVINICKKEKINYVITLIDPELELIGKYKDKLNNEGIIPILSDYKTLVSTFDKYEFYLKYKNIIPLVKTYSNKKDVIDGINNSNIKYPLFAKVRNGSGSEGIGIINNEEDFNMFSEEKNYIYQQYIKGKEYGVDVYFDFISHKIVSVFIKEKISMRGGETDKAISVFREDIFNEVKKLEKISGFLGPIDVDVFVSEDGKIYINEINPRFGGGYPHAYNSGVNFMEKIVNNLNGKENIQDIGNYAKGIIMMKYNGLVFKDGNKIF